MTPGTEQRREWLLLFHTLSQTGSQSRDRLGGSASSKRHTDVQTGSYMYIKWALSRPHGNSVEKKTSFSPHLQIHLSELLSVADLFIAALIQQCFNSFICCYLGEYVPYVYFSIQNIYVTLLLHSFLLINYILFGIDRSGILKSLGMFSVKLFFKDVPVYTLHSKTKDSCWLLAFLPLWFYHPF